MEFTVFLDVSVVKMKIFDRLDYTLVRTVIIIILFN